MDAWVPAIITSYLCIFKIYVFDTIIHKHVTQDKNVTIFHLNAKGRKEQPYKEEK